MSTTSLHDYLVQMGIDDMGIDDIETPDQEWGVLDNMSDLDDDYIEIPEHECDHDDCRMPWTHLERIMHHACLFGDASCGICADMYFSDYRPCRLVSIVSKANITRALLNSARLTLLKEDIIEKAHMFKHRRYFNNDIKEDIIATVMHPSRIQKQMDQFDDIESYFEAMGC